MELTKNIKKEIGLTANLIIPIAYMLVLFLDEYSLISQSIIDIVRFNGLVWWCFQLLAMIIGIFIAKERIKLFIIIFITFCFFEYYTLTNFAGV